MSAAESRSLIVNKGRVAEIHINRERVANSLDLSTWTELWHTIEDLDGDDSVRAIIITGMGEKAFIAGSDIKEMVQMDTPRAVSFDDVCRKAHVAILKCSKPVIAAINGVAYGGGCTIAAACDFRIASDRSRMGLPEVKLGIMPGAGGLNIITCLIGLSQAKRLAFSGDAIDAVEALRIGLIDRVTSQDKLLSEAQELANGYADKPAQSIKLIKSAIGIAGGLINENAVAYDTLGFACCVSTEDSKNAMKRFADK